MRKTRSTDVRPLARCGANSLKGGAGHRFYLNPYEDAAFTKCPKCESKTKVRKFPLVIHIEPDHLFILNKQCRYCVGCDLIITHRSEVESLMAAAFEHRDPAIIGNEYAVMGTLPREVWRARDKNAMRPSEAGRHAPGGEIEPTKSGP